MHNNYQRNHLKSLFIRNSRNMMALPIKKRGRPKKILTDYEIEEATRAAMYTRPAIEITRVPRVFTAEGLAISKDVALDLILAAVEKVEGPDPAMFVAKKSAPAASADSEPPAENSENNKSPKVRLFLSPVSWGIRALFFCHLVVKSNLSIKFGWLYF